MELSESASWGQLFHPWRSRSRPGDRFRRRFGPRSARLRFMEFKLRNGWRYTEQGNRYNTNTEFIRIGFKEYKKLFDLSSFKMNKTEDSLFRYSPKMLSVRQLNHAIDSIGNIDSFFHARSERELKTVLGFVKYKDSAWPQKPLKDTNVTAFEYMIPRLSRITIYDRTLNEINNAKSNINLIVSDYNDRIDSLRRHWIEWNRKFTLSVACLVLFMIGAPLGSIIRKGGLGTPLLFAIVFFVLFHLLNTFGEKAAKSGAINVFSGMWLSTLVLIPIGAFLTIKAMRDSQLFNKEAYYRLFKSLKQLFTKSLPAKK